MAKKKQRKNPARMISAEHITTRGLTLVDERGTVRGRLFCIGSKGDRIAVTNFELMDEDGMPRASIQVAGESTVFQLRFKDQKGHLGFGTHGGPHGAGFGITDENGNLQVRIQVPRSDCNIPGLDSMLQITDRDGKTASVTANGVHIEGLNKASSANDSFAKSAKSKPKVRKKK
jgi:hypothetical protein